MVTAEICLYGNSRIGAGWLAVTSDGRMFGHGEPVPGKSFTQAVFVAALHLGDAGCKGQVRVFAPGGQKMATVDLARIPAFGDMQWEAAPVYTVSVAEIERIAARQEAARIPAHNWQV